MKSLCNALMVALILPLSIVAQEQPYEQSQIIPQEDIVIEPDSSDPRPDSERPVLGAMFSPGESGMLVQSVFTNGPFHQQDVVSDDLIPKLGTVEVRSQQAVDKFLLEKKPGDVVEVTRIRDGVSQQLSVKLISREKLLKVSNTEGDSVANTSRQYVTGSPGFQPYSIDILMQVDQRLKSMQQEIESLRSEIERLRSETMKQQKEAKTKDGGT